MIHQIEVVSIEKMDLYEGTLLFKIGKNEYKAFYYGEEFSSGEIVKVEFDHLELPLDWDVIFNENADRKLKLEEETESDWSYCGYGKIISINPIIADFGDIKLDLGEWTHDSKIVGEYIYWKIDRLNVKKIKQ
jgi:hypothetical protein